MKRGTKIKKIIRFDEGQSFEMDDEVAEEYPLTVIINGEEFATMVCTPTDLDYLVIGFLASEGAIRSMESIQHLTIDAEHGFAYVELDKKLDIQDTNEKRWIGSCCGKSRAFYFKGDVRTARTVMNHFTIYPDRCLRLMEAFHNQAEMFQRTGGVHQASLATADGLEITFSDIGRHNALDKLFGYMLKNKFRKKNHIIIFSGRISSEVLLKVSKIGVGLILSKSAPTDLALQLAEDLNITAVGFVRGLRMNVYSHPERIEVRVKKEEEGGVNIDGA